MPEDPDPCPSSSSSPSSSPSIDPSLNLSPERGETRDKVYMYDKQDIKSPSHFRGGVGEGLDSVSVSVFHDPWRGGLYNETMAHCVRPGFSFSLLFLQTSLRKARQRKNPRARTLGFRCSGDRIRTYDLWVMSPTSYLCSTPRCMLSSLSSA